MWWTFLWNSLGEQHPDKSVHCFHRQRKTFGHSSVKECNYHFPFHPFSLQSWSTESKTPPGVTIPPAHLGSRTGSELNQGVLQQVPSDKSIKKMRELGWQSASRLFASSNFACTTISEIYFFAHINKCDTQHIIYNNDIFVPAVVIQRGSKAQNLYNSRLKVAKHEHTCHDCFSNSYLALTICTSWA